ncbi:hypothetical protein GCM10009804_24950 [Kribbella hippodromi]|uniref:Uncharacterized protein n=1 Tax=Kribbella hippodromi TaxID=434347 RepID=A0ABP4NWX3_9ACTN
MLRRHSFVAPATRAPTHPPAQRRPILSGYRRSLRAAARPTKGYRHAPPTYVVETPTCRAAFYAIP